MPKYTVLISKSVQKLLKKMTDELADKLENKMLTLEDNPRPIGYKKLKGRNAFRIREGDYRIIYEINDLQIIVTVVNVGHRKNIYR
ncbi:MAG: type II toxin-antitoxin system RelE/ParE family toxin [Bacteroidetes bacterium]|nr:type II toxin-antitoxin system RelE/ParE family toxin [Bacteroidota bacterium]